MVALHLELENVPTPDSQVEPCKMSFSHPCYFPGCKPWVSHRSYFSKRSLSFQNQTWVLKLVIIYIVLFPTRRGKWHVKELSKEFVVRLSWVSFQGNQLVGTWQCVLEIFKILGDGINWIWKQKKNNLKVSMILAVCKRDGGKVIQAIGANMIYCIKLKYNIQRCCTSPA